MAFGVPQGLAATDRLAMRERAISNQPAVMGEGVAHACEPEVTPQLFGHGPGCIDAIRPEQACADPLLPPGAVAARHGRPQPDALAAAGELDGDGPASGA